MTGSAGTAMDVIIYAIAFNRRGVWEEGGEKSVLIGDVRAALGFFGRV